MTHQPRPASEPMRWRPSSKESRKRQEGRKGEGLLRSASQIPAFLHSLEGRGLASAQGLRPASWAAQRSRPSEEGRKFRKAGRGRNCTVRRYFFLRSFPILRSLEGRPAASASSVGVFAVWLAAGRRV